MAYLPDYDYDIFISYSHVDNQSLEEGQAGWVELFYRGLRRSISEQFGRDNVIQIWRDRKLTGNETFGASINKACERSAILICVTSPGYMASEWCRKEYAAFCSARKSSGLPVDEVRSRIFNVRLSEVVSRADRAVYDEMFSHSLGYEFYEKDPDIGISLRLWPTRPTETDQRYRIKIEGMARNILDRLESINNGSRPSAELANQYVLIIEAGASEFDREQAEQFIARLRTEYEDSRLKLIKTVEGLKHTKLIFEATRSTYEQMNEVIRTGKAMSQWALPVGALYPAKLGEILLQAKKRLIISGHTINRFSQDDKVREALISLLKAGVEVSLIMLNPKSKYARAHAPYHELESERSAKDQHQTALEFLVELFDTLEGDAKGRLEVLLSNYMPRFRTVIIDDSQIHLYLYMYDDDVSDHPDFVLEKDAYTSATPEETNATLFARVLKSTYNLINAPEVIPFIRDASVYRYWERSKLAQWDRWSADVRRRHRVTHQYYVTHAEEFSAKFGTTLEDYVKEHLNQLKGRILVLGCGSGKELEYLKEHHEGRCVELYGIDFSPEAIRLARARCPDMADHFIVADFYDLDHILDGEFDGIVANAAFVHLFEPGDMTQMLKRIYGRLKPGGSCLIRNLYKERNGKPVIPEYYKSKDRFKDLRWFVYYSRKDLAELARDAGFIVKDHVTRKIGRPLENIGNVMQKGFRHPEYLGVYWPTLLLAKPYGNKRDERK
ncbi:MAG TPA: methyltransferase domain-containing protein [Blastocatellia bacterium]|nr:methyltransferase domain-containing protein [Blastocatellia bacterium]